jgi:hypothetical protein
VSTATIDKARSLESAFLQFHAANPAVYTELVRLASDLKDRGATKIGIKMLFEVLRWRRMRTDSADDFKLNNNHTAFYARLIMEREPNLHAIFDLRAQGHSEWSSRPADVTYEERLF